MHACGASVDSELERGEGRVIGGEGRRGREKQRKEMEGGREGNSCNRS